MQNTKWKGYLYIVLSAVIFGCMPLMAKHLYEDGVNSVTLVALRNAISLPFLLGISLFRREKMPRQARDTLPVFLIGLLGCAITPLLLFTSYQYMASGAATVLHFVYPAAVLLLELLFVRGSVRREGIVAILLCLVGIALFYNPAEGISLVGSLIALASGVVYALYIFLLGRIGKRGMGSFFFSFLATLAATVAMLCACIFGNMLALPRSAFGYLLCAVFAIGINVGAVMLFQGGTFLIGSQRAAVLSTLEPITSLVVGYFAFSERITPLSVIGSVLVLAASVIITGKEGKSEEEDA